MDMADEIINLRLSFTHINREAASSSHLKYDDRLACSAFYLSIVLGRINQYPSHFT